MKNYTSRNLDNFHIDIHILNQSLINELTKKYRYNLGFASQNDHKLLLKTNK